MAKIVLAKGDVILREMPLSKAMVTIGRRPHNDLVIDDLAISGEHAIIITENGDSFLEDLNSTNGTQINGQPVRKHFLRDGDVVELAQYRLEYVAARLAEVYPPVASLTQGGTVSIKTQVPRIRELTGPAAGKEIYLVKALTTLGRPGAHVSMIVRRQDGYFLAHVEGASVVKLNDEEVGNIPRKLKNGDILHIENSRLQFISI
jgi:hypothetical protein